MSNLTLLTGPSVSGKGTRIAALVEYLDSKYEYEDQVRFLEGMTTKKNNYKDKDVKVGRLYPEINLLVFGNHTKKGGWHSIDNIGNMSVINPVFKEFADKGVDVLCDMNSLLNSGGHNINRKAEGFTNLDTIYFHHEDLQEALDRRNGRAQSWRPQWTMEDFMAKSIPHNNERLKLMFEDDDWSRYKVLVSAGVPKHWLIMHMQGHRDY